MEQDFNKQLETAVDVLCPTCDNNTYEKITMLKRTSAIMSPTGKSEIIPVEGFRCTECKRILTPADVMGTANDVEQPKSSLIL